MGDPATGKSALSQMFHSNGQRFPKAYQMTLGVDLQVKAVRIPDTDEAVELHIFDMAGQVRSARHAPTLAAAARPSSRRLIHARARLHVRPRPVARVVPSQDVFAETMPEFWQDAKGAVLVYDVTRVHTLRACSIWYQRLLDATGGASLPGVVVANKVDLRERLAVSRQDGQREASSLGMPYFETSALDGHAVDEPFAALAKMLHGGADGVGGPPDSPY